MMFQQRWGVHEVSEQVYRGHKVGQSYGGRDIFEMIAKSVYNEGGTTGYKNYWLIITHVPDEAVSALAPKHPLTDTYEMDAGLFDYPARSTVLA